MARNEPSTSLLNEILSAYVDELIAHGHADTEAYLRDHPHLADEFLPLARAAQAIYAVTAQGSPPPSVKESTKRAVLEEWRRVNRDRRGVRRFRRWFENKR